MRNLPHRAIAAETWTQCPDTSRQQLTWSEQEQWCQDHCQAEWIRSHGAFWFALEQDKVHFILRWC
jgi:hypothetical protein